MLATLTQVKQKLRIPESDVVDDQTLQQVLDAAESFILSETRFVASNEEREDYFQSVQPLSVIRLSKRPVTNVVASYRSFGSSTWQEISADVLDTFDGIVTIIVDNGVWYLPPKPKWFNWRYPVFDVVKIAYVATALSIVPDDLSDATATLAAYWYQQQLAGAATMVDAGQVREEYSQAAVPGQVAAILAKYCNGVVKWV